MFVVLVAVYGVIDMTKKTAVKCLRIKKGKQRADKRREQIREMQHKQKGIAEYLEEEEENEA